MIVLARHRGLEGGSTPEKGYAWVPDVLRAGRGTLAPVNAALTLQGWRCK